MYLIAALTNCVDIDSSDEEEEESDISDYGEIKNLKLPNNGLSVADVIQQANTQNLKVGFHIFILFCSMTITEKLLSIFYLYPHI